MYRMMLFGHSYLRWIVILLALYVLVRSFLAWRRAGEWGRGDEKLSVALVGLVDVQLLIGLALYFFLSPLSKAFLGDAGAAMKDPLLRFFGMEHLFGMLIAVALFHVGRAKAKRAESAARKHKLTWGFVLAALLVAAIAIPWPGMKYGRPLLRGMEAAPVESPAEP